VNKNIKINLLLLAFLLFFGGFTNKNLPKHDFHTSIADVEYNAKNKTFEVILRVFSDDLEEDFSRTMGKKIILKMGKDKTPDATLTKYLEKYFILKNKKSNAVASTFSINYIARETNAESTLIYFEMLAKDVTKEASKNIFLRNNIMTDLFSDQVNIVNLAFQDKKTTLMFRRGDAEKAVIW
jgi:hypothetical protein